jgi:hypothetical protein
MFFEIVGEITAVELIARGKGVRSRLQLRKKYGPGSWRKLKGMARVRLEDGSEHDAEVHWYEAHGVGKRDIKIKRLVD